MDSDTKKKAAVGGGASAVLVAAITLVGTLHGTKTTTDAKDHRPVTIVRPTNAAHSPLPVTCKGDCPPLIIVGHGAPGGCEPPFCHVGALKTSGCKTRANGQLPDPACTPGAIDPKVTQDNVSKTICVSGYTSHVRHVTAATRRQVILAYGMDPATFHGEIDHYVSLEIGGSNDLANLWPQVGKIPNGKDPVENRLHREICAGKITLADAQLAIATDWRKAR